MDDIEILVNWRAVITSSNGAPPIHGRLSKIGKGKALVKVDHDLPMGYRCSLAVQLPQDSADEESQFVEGQGVVASSEMTASHFHITLHALEINGNGKELLNARFKKHKDARKSR